MNVNVTKVFVENGNDYCPKTKKIQLEIEFNMDQYDCVSHERFIEDFGKLLPRAYNRYVKANKIDSTVKSCNDKNTPDDQLKLDLLVFTHTYCKQRNGDNAVDRTTLTETFNLFYNLVTN
jgi:hypothetical protein